MNIELTKAAAMIIMDLRTYSASRLLRSIGRRYNQNVWIYRTHGSERSFQHYTAVNLEEFDRMLAWKLIVKQGERFRGDNVFILTDIGKTIVIPPVEFLPGEPQL